MKKKFAILILAVLLLLTACAAPNSARGKELGYFTIMGTDWGMSEEEFFASVDIPKENFVREDTIVNDDDYIGFQYSAEDVEFLGKKAVVVFYFADELEGVEPFLSAAQIAFADDFDIKTLPGELKSYLQSQGVPVIASNEQDLFDTIQSGDTIPYYQVKAEATGMVLSEEQLEKAEEGYIKRYTSAGWDLENAKSDFEEDHANRTLSSSYMVYGASKNDAGEIENEYVTIHFTASIAWLDAYAEFAE